MKMKRWWSEIFIIKSSFTSCFIVAAFSKICCIDRGTSSLKVGRNAIELSVSIEMFLLEVGNENI
jgi:hypothetical protein